MEGSTASNRPPRRVSAAGAISVGRQLSTRMQVVILSASGCSLLLARELSLIPDDVSVCLLRNVTGVPCPMCGGLTAVRLALGGHMDQAWTSNPFALVLAVAAAVLGIASVVRPSTSAATSAWLRTGAGVAAIAAYCGIWLGWWALKTW